MAHQTISINRAPVLTLWAAVVAQRLGFGEDEALTLGKAVAGLNAQAAGQVRPDDALNLFQRHLQILLIEKQQRIAAARSPKPPWGRRSGSARARRSTRWRS